MPVCHPLVCASGCCNVPRVVTAKPFETAQPIAWMRLFIDIDGELALEQCSVLNESLHVAREGCLRTLCDYICGTVRLDRF